MFSNGRIRIALLSLALAGPAWSGVLYSNGAINGAVQAYPIASSSAVSDSLVLSSDSTITGVSNIGLWLPTGDTPLTVDWVISTGQLGGGVVEGSATGATLSGSIVASYIGVYDIYSASFGVGNLALAAGTYYLELTNATSVHASTEYVAWDVNSGPSSAEWNYSGPIGSESFEIDGTISGATPEPGSIALLGIGIAGFMALRRFRVGSC